MCVCCVVVVCVALALGHRCLGLRRSCQLATLLGEENLYTSSLGEFRYRLPSCCLLSLRVAGCPLVGFWAQIRVADRRRPWGPARLAQYREICHGIGFRRRPQPAY